MVECLDKLVLEEPHVLRIERDEEWTAPEIDYSLWKRENRREAERAVTDTLDYLNSQYIVDDFEADHSKRREWRMEMEEKYEWFGEYYENNCLKLGSLWATHNMMKLFLPEGYKGNRKKLNHFLRELGDIYPEDYNSKSTDERINLVRAYKGKVYEVLQFLSEDDTLPNRLIKYVKSAIGRFHN